MDQGAPHRRVQVDATDTLPRTRARIYQQGQQAVIA
jgi:hypothetical protein